MTRVWPWDGHRHVVDGDQATEPAGQALGRQGLKVPLTPVPPDVGEQEYSPVRRASRT